MLMPSEGARRMKNKKAKEDCMLSEVHPHASCIGVHRCMAELQ